MNSTFNFLILPVFFFFIFLANSNAQFNLAVGATILTEETNFGINVKGKYQTSESISVMATATYFLRTNTGFAMDFDGHYDNLILGKVEISPLVGFNFRKNIDYGVSMNLGVYFIVPAKDYTLYFEPKFIIDKNTFFAISAGFYF